MPSPWRPPIALASSRSATSSANATPLSATGRPSSKRIDDGLGLDGDVVAPERHAHDRLDDPDALVEELEILRLVRRAEQIRVGRVRLLRAHLVAEAGARQVLRHLLAPAQLVDELRIEPRLVDAQVGIREQPVAIEALDVVALVRAAVAPDVDVVLAHRDDEHRAGDGAAERRRVEVRLPRRSRCGTRPPAARRCLRRRAPRGNRRAAPPRAPYACARRGMSS